MNQFVKKAVSAIVAMSTTLWSVGIAAFPMAVTAQSAVAAGDLVKTATDDQVFYYGTDGKAHAFPNSFTYNTWYADFSSVKVISQAAMDALSFGKNVVYRPGTRLVKIKSQSQVYCVEPGGVLRHIDSETRASTLWGSNWSKWVDDVPTSVFAADYTMGSALNSDIPCEGAVVSTATASATSSTMYYVMGGKKRMITAAQMSEARLWNKYVVNLSSAVLGAIPAGADMAAADISKIADSAQTGSVSTTPTTTGDIMVSVDPSSPSAMNVPRGAMMVEFLVLKLTGKGTLNSLTVTRGGLSANADVANVYILDKDKNQIGNGKTLDSNSQAKFTNLGVKVDGDNWVRIAADIAAAGTATVSNQIILSVEKTSDIGIAGVSGSAPFRSGIMTVSGVAIGGITLDNGPLMPSSDTQIDPTAKDFLITQARVTAGSAEDVILEKVAFTKNGTATTSDIQSLTFKNNKTGATIATLGVAATAPMWKGEKAIFYPELEIKKGEFADLGLYVTMNGGSGRTIAFDGHDGTAFNFYARGKSFGFLVPITQGSFCAKNGANGSTTCQPQTIKQGNFTLAKSPSTLATSNISQGTTQQNLGTFRFTVQGEPLQFSKAVVTIAGTIATANLTNLTLSRKVTTSATSDVTMAGPVNISGGTATFNDTFELPVGDIDVTLKGNVSTSAANNDTIVPSIATPNTATTFTVKGVNSGKTITSNTASTITLNTLTVLAPTITINTASTPVAQNIVLNSQEVELAHIDATVANGPARLSKFAVSSSVAGGAALTDVTGLKLWGPSTLVASGVSSSAISGYKQLKTTNSTETNAANVSFTLESPVDLPIGTTRLIVTGNITTNTGAGAGSITARADATAGNYSFTAAGTGNTVAPTISASVGQALTIKNTGALRINLAATNPTSKVFSSADVDQTVVVYELESVDEGMDVTVLNFRTTLSSTSSWGNIKLYSSDTATAGVSAAAWTQVGGAYAVDNSDNVTTINLTSGQLTVAKNQKKYVKFVISAPTDKTSITNASGGSTGTFCLDNAAATCAAAASNYLMTTTGMSSGTILTANTQTSTGAAGGNVATGNAHRIFRAKLQLSLNSSSPSGKQTAGSNKEVFRFNATTIGGSARIMELEFVAGGTVVPTGTTKVDLRENNTTVLTAAGTTACPDAGGATVCMDPGDGFSFGNDTVGTSNNDTFTTGFLEINGTRTFGLFGDTTGSATDKTLQICIASKNETASGVSWDSEPFANSGVDAGFDNTITEGSNNNTCSNTLTF